MKLFKGRKAVSVVLSAVMVLSSVSFSDYKSYAKELDTTEITSEEVTETSEEVPESTEAEQVADVVTTEATTQETNPSYEVKGSQEVDEAELTIPEKVEKGTIRYVEMKQEAEKISFFKQTLTNVEYREWFYKLSDEDVKKYFGFEKREDFQAEVIYLLLQKEPQEYVKEFTEEEDKVFFGITKEEVLKFFEVATESDANAEENTEEVVTTEESTTIESTTEANAETTTEETTTEEVTTEETASNTDVEWETDSNLEELLPFKSFIMLNDELSEDSMMVYGATSGSVGPMSSIIIPTTNLGDCNVFQVQNASSPCLGHALLNGHTGWLYCIQPSKSTPFSDANGACTRTGTNDLGKGMYRYYQERTVYVDLDDLYRRVFWAYYHGYEDDAVVVRWINVDSNGTSEINNLHYDLARANGAEGGDYAKAIPSGAPRSSDFKVNNISSEVTISNGKQISKTMSVSTGSPSQIYAEISFPGSEGVVLHYNDGSGWKTTSNNIKVKDGTQFYLEAPTSYNKTINLVCRAVKQSSININNFDDSAYYIEGTYILHDESSYQDLIMPRQATASRSIAIKFEAMGWLELSKSFTSDSVVNNNYFCGRAKYNVYSSSTNEKVGTFETAENGVGYITYNKDNPSETDRLQYGFLPSNDGVSYHDGGVIVTGGNTQMKLPIGSYYAVEETAPWYWEDGENSKKITCAVLDTSTKWDATITVDNTKEQGSNPKRVEAKDKAKTTHLSLLKKPVNNIMSNNNLYKITGAEYYIYQQSGNWGVGDLDANKALGKDDKSRYDYLKSKQQIAILRVVDESGNVVVKYNNYNRGEEEKSSVLTNLPIDTYYCIEYKGPDMTSYGCNGYDISNKVYTATTKVYQQVAFEETPGSGAVLEPYNVDPSPLQVFKENKEENNKDVGALSGAVFKLEYWDVIGKENISGTAKKTWYFETKKDGEDTALSYDPSYITSKEGYNSDTLFSNQYGEYGYALGTYRLSEVEAPTGYKIAGNVIKEVNSDPVTDNAFIFYVKEWNSVPKLVNVSNQALEDITVLEQPKRGNLQFIKVKHDTGKPIANVPFKLERVDDAGNVLETHVLVSDNNGLVSTYLTTGDEYNNANDTYLTDKTATISSNNKVWFGSTYNAAEDADKNALVFGKYRLSELRCEANEGYQLEENIPFEIDEDRQLVNLGTLGNSPHPQIETTAKDSRSAGHFGTAYKDSSIIDTVNYKYLTENTKYVVKGKLMIRNEDGTASETSPLIESKSDEFTTPTTTNLDKHNISGNIDVKYTFDARPYEGKTLVVYESLYKVLADGTEKLVTVHEDISDEGQTIYYGKLETTATFASTGTHTGAVGKNTNVVDEVVYSGLNPDNEYRFEGVLVRKSTGEELKDENGEVIKQEKNLKPKSNGKDSIKMNFTFDSTGFEGDSVVIVERVYWNGNAVVIHEDLDDAKQTLNFPTVSTTAVNTDTRDHLAYAGKKSIIIDTVKLGNLYGGEDYKVVGTLMDKSTGEAIKDKDGKAVSSFKLLVANGSGVDSVDVGFKFDATEYQGKDIVVFEELYQGDVLVASHKDINDEGQTITYPKVSTSAIVQDTQTRTFSPFQKEVIVNDGVYLENLVVGKEYEVKGKLIDKATGEPLLDKDGNEYTDSTKITPTVKDKNSVVLSFTFDGSDMVGKSVVVYEELYFNDVLIGSHKDLKDENQTIHSPKIGTKASDVESGTNASYAGETVTLKDTVSYENLIVGETYTIKGKLYNPETGEPILIDGKEVTDERLFKPTKENGTTEMFFTFNGVKLKGEKVVVFEDVYSNGIKVATHSELKDENQTVYFPEVTTTVRDSVTGDFIANPNQEVTLIDKVDYFNTVVGLEYQVKGVLIDKATGEPFKTADDEEVHGESKVFTTDAHDGSVEVEYKFNGVDAKGKTLVVYEELYNNGKVVADHKDIKDEGQTVHFPSGQTSVKDSKTNAKIGLPSEKQKLIDTVDYQNLLVGKEYTIKGVLMVKETKEPLKVNGKEVTSEKTFTAETADGTVELEYEFDSSALAGKTIVVFEDFYYNGINIYSHNNLEDKNQTFQYPTVDTEATYKGKHFVPANKEVTIVDRVSYTNVIEGRKYIMKSTVVDAATGTVATLSSGNEVNTEFTAESEAGMIDIQITFHTKNYMDKKLVVYEELIDVESGEVIAIHKDINDADQTVTVDHLIKTGDSIPVLPIAVIGLVALGGFVFLAVKRRKKSTEE